jgi:flagellar biosynthesis protein FliR
VQSDLIFPYLLSIALISVRVAALFIAFPFFSHAAIPMNIKVFATMAFSVALYPAVGSTLPQWTMETLPQMSEIFSRVVLDFVVGIGMGLVARWIFSAVIASADWIGSQMGFSMGGIFSLDTGSDSSSWAEYINWMAILMFLGVGGHHMILSAVKDSYMVDLSQAIVSLTSSERGSIFWIETGSTFFAWMLKLSAPMVVVMLLLQAGLGVLSKFVPQVNLWVVSIPITLGAGVFVFTLLSPMYGDAIGELFKVEQEFQYSWLKYLGVG